MKKIFFYNLFIFVILIFLLVIFLEFLNFKYAGNPIYDKLKIDRNQLTYIKSKSFQNNGFSPNIKSSRPENYFLNKCGYQESGIYHLAYIRDQNGFRENNHELYKKTDIVMIGDSFAFSYCVNKPYDLKSQLQKISKKKILNLSVSGTGPIEQLQLIKNYTSETDFNTFVWIFYEGNDDNQLKNKKKTDKIAISNAGETLLKSKKDIRVNYNKFKWQNEKLIKLKIFLAEKLKGMNSLLKYFKTYPKVTNYNKYNEILEDMDRFLSKKNLKQKYIYYLPKYTRLAHKNKNHPEIMYLNKIKKYVEIAAKNNDFIFIDGSNFFHNRLNPLDIFHYNLPTHFNEKGYKLSANYINSFISK